MTFSQVVVFDDAERSSSDASIIGIAAIPLAQLADGLPIEGTFPLAAPLSRGRHGEVTLTIKWADPLDADASPGGVFPGVGTAAAAGRGPGRSQQHQTHRFAAAGAARGAVADDTESLMSAGLSEASELRSEASLLPERQPPRLRYPIQPLEPLASRCDLSSMPFLCDVAVAALSFFLFPCRAIEFVDIGGKVPRVHHF